MANVFDVARYILQKKDEMTAMKLQKLCYYSQAWFATWEEKKLFPEEIEAWANGPVIPKLYDKHRGSFLVSYNDFKFGDEKNLTELEKEDIDKILEFYGAMNPQNLSDLTHSEKPWKSAREGLCDTERSNKEITLEAIVEYYGSL